MKTHAIANPYTVYKVVDTSTDKLLSCGVEGEHEITYTPMEIIEHPNMFVFLTLDAAREFGGALINQAIWECRTLEIKPAPSRILWPSLVKVNRHFNDFWGDWKEKGTVFQWEQYTIPTPKGTALIDDIMLIQEVER